MKDYYAILGVPRDADPDEIKRVFRRLARETHPDANPGDPAAEERFREIAEAYEVLSDPQKRAAYDRGGLNVEDLFANFAGIDDLLSTFFGGGIGGFSGPRRGPSRGHDVVLASSVTLEEAAFGTERRFEFIAPGLCPTCNGDGAAPGTTPKTCPVCAGQGAVRTTRRTVLGAMSTVSNCTNCGGRGRVVEQPCPECGGGGAVNAPQEVTVEIPAGIDDGARLRLSGRGGVSPHGGPAGDLYVEIAVEPDPRFVRRGDDLYHPLRLGLAEVALGTTTKVPVLGEEEMPVDIPPGTQHGTVFRIPKRGMPRLRGRGRGDLFVEVAIDVPTDLSAAEEDALRAYAEARGENPRSARRRRRRS